MIGAPATTIAAYSASYSSVCTQFPDGSPDCCSDSIEFVHTVNPPPPTSGLISFDYSSRIMTFGQTTNKNDAN